MYLHKKVCYNKIWKTKFSYWTICTSQCGTGWHQSRLDHTGSVISNKKFMVLLQVYRCLYMKSELISNITIIIERSNTKIPTIRTTELGNGINKSVVKIWCPSEPLFPTSTWIDWINYIWSTQYRSNITSLVAALGLVRDERSSREFLCMKHFDKSATWQKSYIT